PGGISKPSTRRLIVGRSATVELRARDRSWGSDLGNDTLGRSPTQILWVPPVVLSIPFTPKCAHLSTKSSTDLSTTGLEFSTVGRSTHEVAAVSGLTTAVEGIGGLI